MEQLRRVDHLVLVARDVERTVHFYTDVLGGKAHQLTDFQSGAALYPSVGFGDWKINIHPVATRANPRASNPSPGTADFCLWFDGPVAEALRRLRCCNVAVEFGPTPQECAGGWATSIYFRDPDGCLVELACTPEGRS
jgi:catechol 2,3-dioxygenase-like lactoylglutathione lyase family enzyme